MKNDKDGGYAFACVSGTPEDGHLQEGMTLRDYYAGQALVGFMSAPSGKFEQSNEIELAKDSYKMADAMIKARGE